MSVLLFACIGKKQAEKNQSPPKNTAKDSNSQNIIAKQMQTLSPPVELLSSTSSSKQQAVTFSGISPKKQKVQATVFSQLDSLPAPKQSSVPADNEQETVQVLAEKETPPIETQKVTERIDQLNSAIRSKKFHTWKTYLMPSYASYLNSPNHFEYLEKKYHLSKMNIMVLDLHSYFLNVVVPSYQATNTDTLKLIYQNDDAVQIFLPASKNGNSTKILLYCMQTAKAQPRLKEWFIIPCK